MSLLCLGQVGLGFVKVVWAFVGSRDLFIGCRLFLDIPQLLFAPAFDTRPLVSRMIAIVLVGETCDFYRSNALTYQPISSWHGGDVLSRF